MSKQKKIINKVSLMLVFSVLLGWSSWGKVVAELGDSEQARFRPPQVPPAQTGGEEGLVAHWPLDEESGTRQDVSGNGLDLTVVNPPVPSVAGKVGNAAHIQRGHRRPHLKIDDFENNPLDIRGSLSLVGWLKVDSDPIGRSVYWVFTKHQNPADNHFAYSLDFQGNRSRTRALRFFVSSDGIHPPLALTLFSKRPLSVGEWYHVAAVFDVTQQELRLYVDGKLDNQLTVPVCKVYNTSGPLYLGYVPNPNGNVNHTFDGLLDDWRIYDRALTQAEVKALMNNETLAEEYRRPTAIQSTFETDDECWQVLEGGTEKAVSYQGEGHINFADSDGKGTLYFLAPPKFLGNQAWAYDQTLRFELRRSAKALPEPQPDDDVPLFKVSLSSGEVRLYAEFDTPTQNSWEAHAIALSPAGGWLREDNEQVATEKDLQTVLASLDALTIQGDYSPGVGDISSLDNVVFGIGPPYPEDQGFAPECPFCSTSHAHRSAGGPIDTYTGNYNYAQTDFNIPTLGEPLRFERTYNSFVSQETETYSSAVYSRTLGHGWTHNYEVDLVFPEDSGGEEETVILKAPHGSRLRFTDLGDGTYQAYPGIWATMKKVGYTYTITTANQTVYTFTPISNLSSLFWNFELDNNHAPWPNNGQKDANSVPRFKGPGGPCEGKALGQCRFETRAAYRDSNGILHEVVMAEGRYWEWTGERENKSVTVNGVDLTQIERYVGRGGPAREKRSENVTSTA